MLGPQGQIPASIGASLTKDEEFIEPSKSLCASPSCSPFMISGNEDTLNKAGMLDSYPDKLHFYSEAAIFTLKMLIYIIKMKMYIKINKCLKIMKS